MASDYPDFAAWLTAMLQDTGVSIAELGRRLTPPGKKPSDYRRKVHRWLKGENQPSASMARIVARKLGQPEEEPVRLLPQRQPTLADLEARLAEVEDEVATAGDERLAILELVLALATRLDMPASATSAVVALRRIAP